MTILTKTFCNKYNTNSSTDDENYSIEIFDSIDDVEKDWSFVSMAHDIFFGAEFLRCVEKFPATGIIPYYGLVKDQGEPVGIVYFQSKYVRLKENLRSPKSSNGKFSIVTDPFKQALVSAINFETIICGNLLLTGKYGFYFKEKISREDQFVLVKKAIDKLAGFLQSQGKNQGLILVKDFFSVDNPADETFYEGFTKFTVQPKMILDMDSSWQTFDDYLGALKSKYRVRARKAMQKCQRIVKIEFDHEDIAKHRDIIHSLYKNISDQADFNAFVLHKYYFENLKKALGDQLTFTVYIEGGRMVAFYTSILNYDVLDAHFLGYDPEENNRSQLYLNMLYDLIREGIQKKVRIIDLSRTAVEIKS
ncbi:MAG: GNAT family N-acetyltransferase, partial [Saprospiraceae bacterium]